MAEIIKINDKTWRIEDGMVRFYLLCGDEKAALVDTGMNVPEARTIAEGLTDLPVILINTHADPDHISGNGAFEEFYMSPAEEDNYREHGGKGKLAGLIILELFLAGGNYTTALCSAIIWSSTILLLLMRKSKKWKR